MHILGSDLAKKTFDVTLLTPAGTRHHHTFPNTPTGFHALWRWLRTHKATALRACMEATNVYWEALALYLVEHDVTVHVVNPTRIKGYAQSQMLRNKTDKQDSAPSRPSVPHTTSPPGYLQPPPSGNCARWCAIATI